MLIGLITYHYPHLKSEQVLLKLLRKGYNMKIYALPYVPRKTRSALLNHRPDQSKAIPAYEIAERYKIPYSFVMNDREIQNDCDIYLILGAGILSEECVKGKRILNCHPGIIPAVRGLDAFKWAIYDMKPLGVTLHFIDENVDAGEIVAIIPTDVYQSDTLETLARRHYENEIDVLANFEYYLSNPSNPFKDIPEGEPKRRMPISIEEQLLKKFEDYKQKFANPLHV
ncbi:formyltransferase family protein [Fervidobacterium thailandense]|uniref:phosphoribosylglycinamide formyltransferase 1 n=1 Tax=Fervidobacterium thailandense TaxID=1008305 RepID=A0A1E3G4L7_9BACT|nr:formyltransferase family protein [Fervidobacterium thailandense]ODN30588.1 hypothetical protein A4H02_04950 [Fervidobacterium thailandense]